MGDDQKKDPLREFRFYPSNRHPTPDAQAGPRPATPTPTRIDGPAAQPKPAENATPARKAKPSAESRRKGSSGTDRQAPARRGEATTRPAPARSPAAPLSDGMRDTQPDSTPGVGQPANVTEIWDKLQKMRRQLKAFYQMYLEDRAKAPSPAAPSGDAIDLGAVNQQLASLERRVEELLEASRTGDFSALNNDLSSLPTLSENPLFLPARAEKGQVRGNRIDRFLELMVQRGASDLHLTVGMSPMFRDSGSIEPLRYRRINGDDWNQLVQPITPQRTWREYCSRGDADFAYELPDVGRFRVNLFRQHRGGGAVFRVIPTKIMTIDQLALPEQVHRLAKIQGGLILVTGPTGSGKSTTLAGIVNEINENRAYHIITLEDPIEFVHANKKSLIHQREIGSHSPDFATGLRDAVREDPNLLLVGEMRDAETIRLALESAEKGLLVFGTLHTNNAAKTVDRVVNTFPSAEQETIRSILADTTRAVLAQQLVRRKGGGRIAAVEILFGSPALANLIREGKTHQITSLIQMGSRVGMISMDDSLKQLVDAGTITLDSAREKAIDKSLFADPNERKLDDKARKATGPGARTGG